ncbi:MAG TPA: hypothetical protein VMI92_13895 [Steroidobacteraceae bacterium]|nr:hypothetical protein [Steroidobacteraceae bacterium]
MKRTANLRRLHGFAPGRVPGVVLGLALGLACSAATRAADGHFPWKAGDAAPVIGGVHLGEERSEVEKSLGPPPEKKDLDGGFKGLLYSERGLGLVYSTRDAEVTGIYLLSRDAVDLDGVRLGDSRDEVLARWGEPTAVQGAQAIYLAGNWAVIAELGDAQTVVSLSVSRMGGATEELQELYR